MPETRDRKDGKNPEDGGPPPGSARQVRLSDLRPPFTRLVAKQPSRPTAGFRRAAPEAGAEPPRPLPSAKTSAISPSTTPPSTTASVTRPFIPPPPFLPAPLRAGTGTALEGSRPPTQGETPRSPTGSWGRDGSAPFSKSDFAESHTQSISTGLALPERLPRGAGEGHTRPPQQDGSGRAEVDARRSTEGVAPPQSSESQPPPAAPDPAEALRERLRAAEEARASAEARVRDLTRQIAEIREGTLRSPADPPGEIERLRRELEEAHAIIRAIEEAYLAGERGFTAEGADAPKARAERNP